jgi:hypothetical protein
MTARLFEQAGWMANNQLAVQRPFSVVSFMAHAVPPSPVAYSHMPPDPDA